MGYVGETLRLNGLKPKLFVEPFAGGASVSLQLLNDGLVERVALGEKDPLVASFWKTVFWDSAWLARKVRAARPTLAEWERMKTSDPDDRRGRALKCLYLNRTSFSGILSDTAGPIGGKAQTSDYGIGCRFPNERIARRIEQAASLSDRVSFVHKADWARTVAKALREVDDPSDAFFYFDPPFYEKADRLYRFYFQDSAHRALRNCLAKLEAPYLLSYDPAPEVKALYQNWDGGMDHVGLLYSATGSEDPQKADEFVVTSLSDLPASTRLWRTKREWMGDGMLGAPPDEPTPDTAER